MKKKLLAIWLVPALLLVGCAGTPQRIAFNSLYSTEQTVTSTVDGYFDAVAKGLLPTNGVPRVASAYNDFQKSAALAEDAVQYNTNAVTPPALAVEAQDVINLVTQIKGGAK